MSERERYYQVLGISLKRLLFFIADVVLFFIISGPIERLSTRDEEN